MIRGMDEIQKGKHQFESTDFATEPGLVRSQAEAHCTDVEN